MATFPNVTVNTGGEYKACVLPVKDLEMICTTGNNSPASRPEFVDLSLNATSDIEQLSTEDSDSGDEDSGEKMVTMEICLQAFHLRDKSSIQFSYYSQDLDLPMSTLSQRLIETLSQ